MYKKIDKYLKEIEYVGSYEDHEYGSEGLTDRMIDFFMTLDPDNLYDEQLDMYMNIMSDFDSYADDEDEEYEDDNDSEEMSEAVAAKKKKRDRVARLQRKAEYRKKKSALKTKAKHWRKTAAYKKYMKKKKKMASRGKTARGKRISKFYG